MTESQCEQCREPINESASTCPYCGYEGNETSGILGVVLLIIGGLFTMTIIGAVLGLPMMYVGYRLVKRGGKNSPTTDAQGAD